MFFRKCGYTNYKVNLFIFNKSDYYGKGIFVYFDIRSYLWFFIDSWIFLVNLYFNYMFRWEKEL